MEFEIKEYGFNKLGKELVASEELGKDWPVVYLINNSKELYIGETQNIYNRFEQHLKNDERKELNKIKIIFDKSFNKSATLDIEQSLIQLFAADNKYKLQNLNGGQSAKHNYYQREKYLNIIDEIWENLCKKFNMSHSKIEDIRNSDLFKYSPYNTLTDEQNEVCLGIIYDIMSKLENNTKGVSIINGTVGTGKTIVIINMIYKLINAGKIKIDYSDDASLTENNQLIHDLNVFIEKYKKLKIGFVVPMTSIRKTLKKVFKNTKNGLESNMIIGPYDAMKNEYDILFVDEAHRLTQYKNLTDYNDFIKNAKIINENNYKEVTQLDMILHNSKYAVLVYDENQTVKGSDITNNQFFNSLKNIDTSLYTLTSQMRCKGGTPYINYISNILNCTQKEKLPLKNYDFKLFDNCDQMINIIKQKDKEIGLCRNAAGYSWKWKSKKCKTYNEVIIKGLEDIDIDNHKYVWNMNNQEFILSNNSVNEIGCVHTLQGYDLNYCGVIFGKEIDYDGKQIIINRNNFYDSKVKDGSDDKTLKQYIINTYRVIMSRGIRGCYVYVCNEGLRNYLKQFIDVYGE